MIVNLNYITQLLSNSLAWASISLHNEIQTLLEFSDLPNEDLTEINKTLTKSKQILGKHLTLKLNINEYDVCLQGIKDALAKLKIKLIDIDFSENKKKEKIEILRLDFLLNFRLNQFSILFPVGENNVLAIPSVDVFFSTQEDREFWRSNFQQQIMVPWRTFFPIFCAFVSAPNMTTDQQLNLRNFIDLTRDGFVTPFELQLFTRWFGPLKLSVKNLFEAINLGIIAGFIPAFEAESILADSVPGTFLFRISKSHTSSFALALVGRDGKVKHSLISTSQLSLISFANNSYHSISHFAKSMHEKLTFPANYCWFGCKDDDILEDSFDDGLVDIIVDQKKEKKNSIFVPRSKSLSNCCIKCLINPIQTVFLECGHVCCCKPCSSTLVTCPTCGSVIVRAVEIQTKSSHPISRAKMDTGLCS